MRLIVDRDLGDDRDLGETRYCPSLEVETEVEVETSARSFATTYLCTYSSLNPPVCSSPNQVLALYTVYIPRVCPNYST